MRICCNALTARSALLVGLLGTALSVTVSGAWAADLDMGGDDINNVGTITASTITTSSAVNLNGGANINGGLNLSGPMFNDLDMNGHNINNVNAMTASGQIQGGTLTDGTASLTGGALTGATTVTASGQIQGGTLTDGTASLTGGALTGATTVTASGQIQGGTLTDGVASLSGGALTGATSVQTATLSVTGSGPGTVNMGGNRVENVADPILATDAATKGYVDTGLSAAFKEIDRNTQGIAIAMAMSGMALPDNKTFAVGVNLGFYDDKQALAVQGALRLTPYVSVNGGLGVGLNDNSRTGGRVGLQVGW